MAKTLTQQHWNDCPTCDTPYKVMEIGTDTRKRPVYWCDNCQRRYSKDAMDRSHRFRVMRD